MFEIEFYEDKNGYSETETWIMELDAKAHTNKECRVRLKKFVEYMEILRQYGTYIGEPVVKKLVGTEFWELRPTRDRIIFVHIFKDRFLLLNHFIKKTEKTPPREIERARRMLADYIERSGNHEQME